MTVPNIHRHGLSDDNICRYTAPDVCELISGMRWSMSASHDKGIYLQVTAYVRHPTCMLHVGKLA